MIPLISFAYLFRKETHLNSWIAGLIILGLSGAQLAAQQKTALKTQKDKVSYCIGIDIGRNFKQQQIEINPEILIKGMKDVLAGASLSMTDDEMREVMMAFQSEMMGKMEERSKHAGEKNKTEGETFLTENKKKPGIVTLPSGLQYKILVEGKGKKPSLKDTVTAHYRGTLIDGTEFDSSYKRGEPASFAVTGVIKGWTEVLQLMKVGSKWQVYIPSHLAYGDRAASQEIGPNSTLIFEIELIAVQ